VEEKAQVIVNDEEIRKHCDRVKALQEGLQAALVRGSESGIWEAMAALHDVSREALWRINDIRYARSRGDS